MKKHYVSLHRSGTSSGILPIVILPTFAFAFALWAFLPSATRAEDAPNHGEPKLLSVFPLAGHPGTTVQAEVRGNWLDGSTGVWFETKDVSGRLLKVDELKPEPNEKETDTAKSAQKPRTVYRALVELQIDSKASASAHSLRLIGRRGISSPVSFHVVSDPVVMETTSPHETVEQAQPVSFPVVINGKLEKAGELDYYRFHAKRGQALSFQVVAEENCDPRLGVFRAGGSWFDDDRPTRLLFQEERSSDVIEPVNATRTFQASQDGDYYLEVSALFGVGKPDSYYQVRISPKAHDFENSASPDLVASGGSERSFTRELDNHWLLTLETREVPSKPPALAPVRAGAADETTDSAADANSDQKTRQKIAPLMLVKYDSKTSAGPSQQISVPAVITGTIDHPGAVDQFKFKVKAGEKLAFEVETPETQPPFFNPTISVMDSQDHEVFSNVQQIRSLFNNNGTPFSYLNRVEPRATFNFEHEGEYTLNVHDITSRYGDPSFQYKVLVRPEVPHLGDVRVVGGDQINLIRGEAKKISVVASYEEGFAGDVYFRFGGLPDGVQAYAGTQSDAAEATINEKVENPNIVSPTQQKTVVVLVASTDAKLSSQPAVIQLYSQPMVKGKLGASRLVRELPLMVVEVSPGK